MVFNGATRVLVKWVSIDSLGSEDDSDVGGVLALRWFLASALGLSVSFFLVRHAGVMTNRGVNDAPKKRA